MDMILESGRGENSIRLGIICSRAELELDWAFILMGWAKQVGFKSELGLERGGLGLELDGRGVELAKLEEGSTGRFSTLVDEKDAEIPSEMFGGISEREVEVL